MGLGIGFDQRHLFRGATGKAQIAQGLAVNREKTAGGTVFGRHVGDGGAFGQAKTVQTGAEKFNKFADDAVVAQQFYDIQDQIGCGCAFRQCPAQPEPDYFGNPH